MRPPLLTTKVFLDSGDPEETRAIIDCLSFLDGQTTNPSLVAKNPDVVGRISEGNTFRAEEINEFYKRVVTDISQLIPEGSVSIEVYADADTSKEEMVAEARIMNAWVPNAHIKLPITQAGLGAAEQLVSEGIRVNMTLCFSQSQAGAVHAATRGAPPGAVFVSPFIGRLDDRGEQGMDLIKNIVRMYREVGSHVSVLAASVRDIRHLLTSFQHGADIVTAPAGLLREWGGSGMALSPAGQRKHISLTPIAYESWDLEKPWQDFSIDHELTKKGLERFTQDWNRLIGRV